MTRFLTAASVLSCLAAVALGARSEVPTRTIYISALDNAGKPVTDLTSAELVVQENGKTQAALNVERATQPMKLALIAHNRGQGNAEFREGLTAFVDAMKGRGDMAIFATGHPQTTVVNFTADHAAWRSGIDVLVPQRAPTSEDVGFFRMGMSAGTIVRDLAHQFASASTPRPVIVVIWVPVNSRAASASCGSFPCNAPRAEPDPTSKSYIGAAGPRPISESAEFGASTVDQLRQSRATFYAVSTRDGAGVFSDGARVTGGRVETMLTDAAVVDAMKSIAAEIASQYAVTYNAASVSKDGAKLRVQSTRPGVKIRAPERVR
jgi:hypothetical protein